MDRRPLQTCVKPAVIATPPPPPPPFSIGSPVSAQPVIMAAPSHAALLPSGAGKSLALVPGGGGQMQPIPVLQTTAQPSVTMVRVVTHPLTSIPLNGYSGASLGVAEGNGEFRGTGAPWVSLRSSLKRLSS